MAIVMFILVLIFMAAMLVGLLYYSAYAIVIALGCMLLYYLIDIIRERYF